MVEIEELLEHPVVRTLADAFAREGHDLYLVGGSVRDLFSDATFDDLDFTTPARPDVIENLVAPLGPVWDAGKHYGTIGVSINGQKAEITTFRSDIYDGRTRKPNVEFGDNITHDLMRRDFTINAMAVNITNGELIDPFFGGDDLDHGILRTPCQSDVTIKDDPLRSLRAIRFVATRDMMIEHYLQLAIRDNADALAIVSQERKTAELMKIAVHGVRALLLAHRSAVRLGVVRHLFGDLVINDMVISGVGNGIDALASISVDTKDIFIALSDMRFSLHDVNHVAAIHNVVRHMPRDGATARRLIRALPDDVLFPALAIARQYDMVVTPLEMSLTYDREWARAPLPVDGNDFLLRGLQGRDVGTALKAVESAWLESELMNAAKALMIGLKAVHD